jgi:nucleotide-binding universal stress UspA family protein
MRILLAVDGSQASQDALDELSGRPWPDPSVVRVLCVIQPFAPPVTEFALSAATMDDVRQAQQTKAERLTAAAVERLSAQRLSAEGAIREGDARSAIIAEADEWNADLVVMGSHGHSGLHRLLMGSVAQAVVAHAPCSVEVVRRRRQSV